VIVDKNIWIGSSTKHERLMNFDQNLAKTKSEKSRFTEQSGNFEKRETSFC
jgi:hypothetical protein